MGLQYRFFKKLLTNKCVSGHTDYFLHGWAGGGGAKPLDFTDPKSKINTVTLRMVLNLFRLLNVIHNIHIII